MTALNGLAKVLRDRRLELGVTQEHIAARLGVSQSAVARWETGKRIPSGVHMLRLCHLLRISYDEMTS